MPTWPATLPQEPNGGNYKETPPNLLIQFKPDFGPGMDRRRGHAGVRKLSLPFDLTAEEVEILENFVYEDLAGGALPFNFPWPPDPRGTETVSAKIVPPWTYEHRGAGVHRVTLEVEILP